MKEINKIDDFFRDGLDDFEMNPSEKSWHSLNTSLLKKQANRKIRKRFMFFSITLLLLFSGLISYKYYSKNTALNNEKKNESISTNKNVNNNKISSSSKSSNFSTPVEKDSFSIISGGNKTAGKSEIKYSPQPIPKLSVKKSDLISIDPVIKLSELVSGKNDSLVRDEPKITENQKSNNSINTNNSITESDPKQIDISDDSNKISIQNEIIVDHTSVNKNSNVEETNEINAPLNSASIIESNNTDFKKDMAIGVDSGKTTNTDNSDYTNEQNTESTSLIKKIISHLSFGIFYSPDYVWNKIKVNDSYTGTASQKLSDYENQKAAFSYSTGINIRYSLGKKWSMGSGISYSTFAQNAVYNTVNVVADSVYRSVYGHRRDPRRGGNRGLFGNIHIGQNPHRPPGNGNLHFVIQTPFGAIDLYREPPHRNRGRHRDGDTLNLKTETSELLQFINIPLTLRYQFGNHKLSYFVEGGAAVSFVEGNIVKVTIDDSYTENNEHDGLRNINYSLLIGAGVHYNFYKGLNLSLKPSLRYTITPINLNNPMYSYPYYLGAEAGFSIQF